MFSGKCAPSVFTEYSKLAKEALSHVLILNQRLIKLKVVFFIDEHGNEFLREVILE